MTDAETTAEGFEELAALSAEQRQKLCDEVMAHLSDLVEGSADPALRAKVEKILGRCRPYLTVRDTLECTIHELRGLGQEIESTLDREAFASSVETVRRRLESEGSKDVES